MAEYREEITAITTTFFSVHTNISGNFVFYFLNYLSRIRNYNYIFRDIVIQGMSSLMNANYVSVQCTEADISLLGLAVIASVSMVMLKVPALHLY